MAQDDDPLEFAPGVLEEINRDPGLKKAAQEMFANMRQAHQAWRDGRYPTFDDAMEAITGNRPTKIDGDC